MEKIYKLLFLLFLIIGANNILNAQVSAYTFSQTSGVFVPVTTPTTIHASGWDDAVATVAIPFTFTFNGTGYTSCSVNSNGFVSFGAVSAAVTLSPISGTGTYSGAISVFGRDLVSNSTTVVSGIEGTAPNRSVVIQWNNARRYNASAPVTGDALNFQIRLNETSNTVDIVYGSNTATSTTALTSQVGLRGASNSDYNNRSSSTSWTATIAGASNTASVTSSNTIMPTSGLTFTYTPPAACTGTPEAGTISGSLIRAACGGNQPNQPFATATGITSGVTNLALQWEVSTNNIDWSNASGATSTTASYTIPNHVAGQTEYYRLKVTCTPSGLFDVSDVVLQVIDPAAPLVQAAAITTTALGLTTATIGWSNGTGSRRFAVINNTNSFTAPVGTADVVVAGTVYSGSGQQIIFDGTGSSVSVTGLTQGTTYYVRVYEYLRCTGTPNSNYYNVAPAADNPGSFTTAVPAPNDLCSGATTIPSAGPFPYLTSVASNTGAGDVGDPANTCQSNSHGGLWYSFSPSVTGTYIISSCQTDAPLSNVPDNVLSIYSSMNLCAGPFSQVACDDDGCTSLGLQAFVSTTLTAGIQYYILLYGYDFNRGDMQLSVKLLPANDACAGATDLTPVPGIFNNPGVVSLASSTPSTTTASCVTIPSTKQDIWFKLTSDNDGIFNEHINLAVTPLAGTDIAIVLYGGSCGTLIQLACKDDLGDGAVENIIYTEVGFTGDGIEVRDNTTYYLRVIDKFNENTSVSISASGSTALPVSILSFTANTVNNKTVDLVWNVADEINVKEYMIERSNDNRNWSAIGTVNASQKTTYNFNDNKPVGGINYYRLAVNDRNSSVAFSEVRSVNFSGKGNMALYPNPANNTLFVSGTDDKHVTVSIYNEVGQIVATLKSSGETIRTGGVDVSKLLPGAYSIQVKGESGLTTLRFVKK